MEKNSRVLKKIFSISWKIAALMIFAGIIAFLILFLPVVGLRLDTAKLEFEHEAVTMLDGNGQKMDTETLNLVQHAKIEELNDYTYNAFVAIEDKRFFTHNGVDAIRIGSAVLENVKTRSYKEGASTITQQLVKNLFLTNEKSLQRKTKEIALAVQMEKEYSKMQILEMYLNTIYFGNNAYGINQAAKCYFNKTANELTLAESASLAAIIKSPAAYAPDKDFEKNCSRKNLILTFMLEQNMIDSGDYEAAKNETVKLNKNIQNSRLKGYEHAALSEAAELLNISVPQIKNSGLKIHTYHDHQKQNILDAAFKSDNSKTVGQNDAYKMGIIADNKTGGITAYFGNSLYSLYNQERQIGSTAKPLAVYASAFEQNIISPASPILDEATDFEGYSPQSTTYAGWTTVREALKNSRNVPAVKIFNSLNKNRSAQILRALGFMRDNEEINLSMALGSFNNGIGIEQLTAGYMCLANNGVYKQTGFVKKITDEKGNVLYSRNVREQRLFRSDSAFLTTDILKDVAKTGTAKTLADLHLPIAGKTGTVGQRGKNNSDAIFAAYTPADTVTIWIFSEYDDLLQSGVSGSTVPVSIAKNVFKELYPSGVRDFTAPSGVRMLSIDKVLLEQEHKIVLSQSISPPEECSLEYFSINSMPRITSERIQIIVPEPDPEPEPHIVPEVPWYKPRQEPPPAREEKPKPKTFWDKILEFF